MAQRALLGCSSSPIAGRLGKSAYSSGNTQFCCNLASSSLSRSASFYQSFSTLSDGVFRGQTYFLSCLPSREDLFGNAYSSAALSSRKPRFFLFKAMGGMPDSQLTDSVESIAENGALLRESPALIGEDSATFDVTSQKLSSWLSFTAVLGVVMALLYVLWLQPTTGFGDDYEAFIASVSSSSEMEMVLLLLVFAVVHSGGAALRSQAEKVIGERAFRVIFAGLSLPLAVSAVVFFINHRYDGIQLWQLRTVPGVHELVWLLSLISFFFLYPSTFNLLEVAAVDRPKLHLWETGIIRVTRHPQMVGQLIWCFAHTLWIGNSFTLVTSLALIAHHAFGVWHGDQRLSAKYGAAFEQLKERTSVVPFAAIIDGRQKLPDDFNQEFMRLPYFIVLVASIGAYFSHPLIQLGSYSLGW